MAFTTTRANLMQSAVKAASELVAAEIGAGFITELGTKERFVNIRDDIFNTLLAEHEADQAAPAQPSYGRGQRRGYGSGQTPARRGANASLDPATLVLNSGKYAGQTLQQIHDSNPEYFDIFLAKGKNEFVKSRMRAFLDNQSGVDRGTEASDPETTDDFPF